MKRSAAAASASGLRAARGRIAWCMVGTAVYQVGRASLSHWKKRSALKPGVQKTLPPAASEDSTAAISPWMWNSGMMLRQRSSGRQAERRADMARRGGEIGMAAAAPASGRDVVPEVCSNSAMSPASANPGAAGGPIASPSIAEAAGRRVVQRDQPEHADAEALGHRHRRSGLVLGDEDRLGADVGQVEIEFLGPVGRIERRRRGGRRRPRRTPSPSPARSAARWPRGRRGRCRARSAAPAASLIRRRSPPWVSVVLSGAEIAGASSRPPAIRSTIDFVSDNTDLKIAHSVDMALEDIAALDRADAGGRARHDDVAGHQREQAGQVADHLRHLPDHLVEIAGLLALAVDVQPDGALGRDGRSRLPEPAACRAPMLRTPCRPPMDGPASSPSPCRSRRVMSRPTP